MILGLVLLPVLPTACGLDNYDAPESLLQGKIVYQGRPIGLRSTSGAIQLQLYQDGYAKRDPIPVYVNQEGEFSAKLFAGEYKLVTRDGNGPWVNSRDTLAVSVKGTTQCTLEVVPYYIIDKYEISLDGDNVRAAATIEKIVPEASVERVIVAVGKTRFVDESTNLAQKRITLKDEVKAETILNMKSVSGYDKAAHLYARIGVRAVGADQYVFTPVIQLK